MLHSRNYCYKKAEEKFDSRSELQEIESLNTNSQHINQKMRYAKCTPDFDELRESDDFHNWAEEQPKWVQDALYENQDDPRVSCTCY